MKEEFIHFLWKYRLFHMGNLETTLGQRLEILAPGIANNDSGPDFTAARIRIDATEWAGNVEIHLKSSDWDKHSHHKDPVYNNVILHVVMHHDTDIKDASGEDIPVFEVRHYFDMALFYRYERILQSKTWVPCAGLIHHCDKLVIANWLNRLMVERLESKSEEVLHYLKFFENNWEQTFYFFLARNFGFKVNAAPFGLMAQNTAFKIIAKHRDDLTSLEAMLFGQAGMLDNNFTDAYPELLRREYSFFRHKYSFKPIDKNLWKFARLRPMNFPTIRIAQFAGVLHKCSNLMGLLLENQKAESYIKHFQTQGSAYWLNHYQFDSEAPGRIKNLGKSAIENLIINTVIPMKFVYGNHSLNPAMKENAIMLLTSLSPEENNIISGWKQLGIRAMNAGDSQALIQLKKQYCTTRKCLGCAIGHNLVRKNID